MLGMYRFFWARARERGGWGWSLAEHSWSSCSLTPPWGWPLSPPVKEEEKQKLLQRGSELQTEHQQLEERDRQLASAVKVSASGVGPSSPAHRTHRPTGSGCSSDVDHDSLPSIWGHSEAPSSQLGPWQGPAFLNLNFVLYKENIVLCRLIGKG